MSCPPARLTDSGEVRSAVTGSTADGCAVRPRDSPETCQPVVTSWSARLLPTMPLAPMMSARFSMRVMSRVEVCAAWWFSDRFLSLPRGWSASSENGQTPLNEQLIGPHAVKSHLQQAADRCRSAKRPRIENTGHASRLHCAALIQIAARRPSAASDSGAS